jgi:hypothetical protein
MNCSPLQRACALAFHCLIGLALGQSVSADDPTQSQLDFFESKIRPLLIDRCYECHSQESGESEGDLLIDSAAAMKRGGANGPLIGSGDPEKSLLVRVIQYNDRNLQMPPSSKLPQEEIDLIRRWLAMGAPDPRPETKSLETLSPLSRDPSTHWAFVKPQLADNLPDETDRDRDVIDVLASSRSAQAKLENAPQASRDVACSLT